MGNKLSTTTSAHFTSRNFIHKRLRKKNIELTTWSIDDNELFNPPPTPTLLFPSLIESATSSRTNTLNSIHSFTTTDIDSNRDGTTLSTVSSMDTFDSEVFNNYTSYSIVYLKNSLTQQSL